MASWNVSLSIQASNLIRHISCWWEPGSHPEFPARVVKFIGMRPPPLQTGEMISRRIWGRLIFGQAQRNLWSTNSSPTWLTCQCKVLIFNSLSWICLRTSQQKNNIFPVDSSNDGFPLGKIRNLLMKCCLIIKFKIKTLAVKHNNHQYIIW